MKGKESHQSRHRRGFVSRLIIGAITLPFLAKPQVFAAELDADQCRVSPSDSLLLYQRLVENARSEKLIEAGRILSKTTAECETILRRLQNRVEELLKEVQGLATEARAREMAEIADAGRSNLAALGSMSVPGLSASGPFVLADLATEELGRMAQDLLPSDEIILSAKAKSILEDIIKIVRDSTPVADKAGQARVVYQQEVDTAYRLADEALDAMSKASVAIDPCVP